MTTTLTRTYFLRAAIVCALGCAGGQVVAQSLKLQVIPAPKEINHVTEDRFDLRQGTRIILADPQSEDDRFAAQDFVDDLKQSAGVTVRLGGNSATRILIGRMDLPKIQAALVGEGSGSSANWNSDEAYILMVGVRQIVVAGKTTAGTFYGLQTLKQLVRGEGSTASIPVLTITDWPTMRWRAVSDDISRGPVPTLDYIKRQIRTEAFFKLNMHSFYMEHTFQSE
ncbi:MAG TPA: beta-N-acetylhexosaminidase, partial [Pyrinomonadaceae bacterium]|nr:beta-N-acetylhexosaminidase [Pyrinomonadaceae bacterium]